MIRKRNFQILLSPIFFLLAILTLIFSIYSYKVKEDYTKKLDEIFLDKNYINNVEKYFKVLVNLHKAEVYYYLSKNYPNIKKFSLEILNSTIKQVDNEVLKKDIQKLILKVKNNKIKSKDFYEVSKKVESFLLKNKINHITEFPLKFKDIYHKEKDIYLQFKFYSENLVSSDKLYKQYVDRLIDFLNDTVGYKKLEIKKNNLYSFSNFKNLLNNTYQILENQFNLYVQTAKQNISKRKDFLERKYLFYRNLYIISFFLSLIIFIYGLFLFYREKGNIEKILLKDDITNTYNKEAFFELIKDKEGFLIILDLVKFKRFNEIYGRNYGDKVLKVISKRLFDIFRNYNPIISRLWSNTFVVFIPFDNLSKEKKEKLKSYAFLKRVKERLEESILLNDGVEYSPKFTLILTQKPNCLKCVYKNIFNQCDFYSYVEFLEDYAKQQNKGSIIIYEGTINFRDKLKDIIQKERLLHKAIKEDRIVAYFQPIVDSKTYKPYALECLARIIDENNKVLPAGMFIDLAIETGLIIDIDLKVLKYISKVRKDIPIKLFINLSPKSLYSKYIFEELKNIYLGNSVFEITEQFLVENLEQLERLRKELNLDFAVDDFGTGFSSLHTVIDLSSRGIIRYLKIDGSLIQNVTNDKRKQEIIETIVLMAKKLHLKTIAEFVEDEKTAKLLNKLGVDFLQGYYFAPPMPLEKIKEYLRNTIS